MPRTLRWGRRQLVIPLVAVVVIVVDQLTKTWVVRSLHGFGDRRHVVATLYWYLTLNTGAAFSLGRGVTPIVEAAAVVLVIALLFLSRRASRAASLPVCIGLGLLAGGALSNLGDRVFRHYHGAVVDWIQAVSWWPVFNVADACIVIGVIVLLLSYRAAPSRA